MPNQYIASQVVSTDYALKDIQYGGILFHQLRALLLFVDENAELSSGRAFYGMPNQKNLFDTHQIVVADNRFFNQGTWNTIQSFFDSLPSHMMTLGVTFDAPWAVMQVKDSWTDDEKSFLGFTNRAWNIWPIQVTQNARGLMDVFRHEVSHQFDRFRDDNMRTRFFAYKHAATKNTDWAWPGNDYFQENPQEIIAYNIGNLFLRSGTTQLQLAIDRFHAEISKLPFMWFLWTLDLFASGTSAIDSTQFLDSVIFDQETTSGITTQYNVALTRDNYGRIVTFSITTNKGEPDCPTVEVTYESDELTSHALTVSPNSWDCILTESGQADGFNVLDPVDSSSASDSDNALGVGLICVSVLLFITLCVFLYRELRVHRDKGIDAVRISGLEGLNHPVRTDLEKASDLQLCTFRSKQAVFVEESNEHLTTPSILANGMKTFNHSYSEGTDV